MESLIGYLSLMSDVAMNGLKENGTMDEICVEQNLPKRTTGWQFKFRGNHPPGNIEVSYGIRHLGYHHNIFRSWLNAWFDSFVFLSVPYLGCDHGHTSPQAKSTQRGSDILADTFH